MQDMYHGFLLSRSISTTGGTTSFNNLKKSLIRILCEQGAANRELKAKTNKIKRRRKSANLLPDFRFERVGDAMAIKY
jgi:hypothetical protein